MRRSAVLAAAGRQWVSARVGPPPSYASAGSYWATTNTTHAVPAPGGVAGDSLIVLTVYIDGSTNPGITLPSGFTHAENSPVYVDSPGLQTQNHRLVVAWHRASGAESGPYTLTLGSSRYVEAQTHRYEGVVTAGAPFDVGTAFAGIDETNSSTSPLVSITTAGPQRTLLHAATNWAGGTWTAPTGFTKREQGSFGLITLADKAQSAAGATGSIAALSTSADKTQAWLGALIPGGGSGGGTDTHTRFQVQGRHLNDPNGDRIVLRGVENRFWAPWLDPTGNFIPQIALTGANAVRLMPYYPPETPPTGGITPLSIPQIQNLIDRTLAGHMVPILHFPGAATIAESPLLDPDVQELLMPDQDRMIIDGIGESEEDDPNVWADISADGLVALRQAGYTCPLIFMSNTFGRNLPTILDHGADVVAADPLGNTMLGWQAYWGSPGNNYQNLYGMTLAQGMAAVAALSFPVQVGVIYQTDKFLDPTQVMDYQTVITAAATYGISWLWWDWTLTGEGEDLVFDGDYGVWQPGAGGYGEWVGATSPYGLSGATRTAFLNSL